MNEVGKGMLQKQPVKPTYQIQFLTLAGGEASQCLRLRPWLISPVQA
jgi:hypothetical protein